VDRSSRPAVVILNDRVTVCGAKGCNKPSVPGTFWCEEHQDFTEKKLQELRVGKKRGRAKKIRQESAPERSEEGDSSSPSKAENHQTGVSHQMSHENDYIVIHYEGRLPKLWELLSRLKNLK